MRRAVVDPRFPARLRELRQERGLSLRRLADRVYYSKSLIHELEAGTATPTVDMARRLDQVLEAGGNLAALALPSTASVGSPGEIDDTDDELDAVDLARRVEASDVSTGTLERLERAVDDLATAYATTPPVDLLPRIRRHLGYIRQLVDARTTLQQHRRILVIGGWLSLLGATVHIDLRQQRAAEARLITANEMASHAGNAEIQAWCLETRAWDALTGGDYRRAVELSQRAQAIAPRDGSAHIQSTAQEGRAWARMGERARTRDILDRVTRLVSSLAVPDRPEHHYQYDPDKALAYTATTLAWTGDPAAEEYARAVIRQLEATNNSVARPRRVASARLDLGLALLAADKPDEACAEAMSAITSGRVVPSNWWRATEVVTGVERADIRDAEELRDAYETYRPATRNA
jgi:transcriptional regulator with XRE-family HTH domain